MPRDMPRLRRRATLFLRCVEAHVLPAGSQSNWRAGRGTPECGAFLKPDVAAAPGPVTVLAPGFRICDLPVVAPALPNERYRLKRLTNRHWPFCFARCQYDTLVGVATIADARLS
jgi:hypothetical protein